MLSSTMNTRFVKIRTFSAVVLTGGSSGIGLALLKTLSCIHPDLFFCNISRTFPVDFKSSERLRHIACDLTYRPAWEEAVPQVLDFLRTTGTGRILLVNNSGFGSYGAFPAPNIQHQLDMIDLNVRAPVALVGALLPFLQQRGGAVVNVASTAAFQPTPWMATYGASKAFLLHWSLALHQDLRPYGIPVLAVCPGPTATNFFRRAGFHHAPVGKLGQTADQVAWTTLRALERESSLVVSGWLNRMLTGLSSLLPKRCQAPLAGVAIKSYRKPDGF